ncbi:hypothetical protein JVT61DRAFT_628 [Boletus reticuloceps]|uniref:Uncharacterized protein n=1 Tax=Boletus reticuloceps TaxID=495285 RepID=A0A8I2Z3P1_9AGAM|nr:hypothetical protein JVT61DRAFT_628 [Boletus reticuloceps]
MESSLDLLEEKFRRVEQASERKALYELEPSRTELAEPLPQPRKHHKKPAVSVSQFGKPEEQGEDGLRSLAPSPLSAAASKSTFYHTLANPRSVESFVSEISEETQHTDEQHEILVERIAGRQTLPQTVGALLPRRLTRVQSHLDYTSINGSMVIDVSVETTMESTHLAPDMQSSTVYTAGPSRSRAATVGVMTFNGGLVERAKDLARKLRRKSGAELP